MGDSLMRRGQLDPSLLGRQHQQCLPSLIKEWRRKVYAQLNEASRKPQTRSTLSKTFKTSNLVLGQPFEAATQT